MTIIPTIHSSDYHYILPDEKIARFPLEKRDEAKLLVYKNQHIYHSQFKNITQELVNELGKSVTLFFNNTRVIPARLHFYKESGGIIEIFLLSPILPSSVSFAMLSQETCVWKCLVGGLKKWKDGTILTRQLTVNDEVIEISVELINREAQTVKFSWQCIYRVASSHSINTFAEIITLFGNTPLPPYLNRKAQETDKQQYQTVYAKNEGAVAAPTAGLHFTDEVLQTLTAEGITTDFITLHVGGGTFQPIKTENATAHQMHAEQIIVSQKNIENLLKSDKICAVGTTSMRTLESLYWLGLEVFNDNETVKQQLIDGSFFITQFQPYEAQNNEFDNDITNSFFCHSELAKNLTLLGQNCNNPDSSQAQNDKLQNHNLQLPDKQIVMKSLLQFMQNNNMENISGETQIMIIPSYQFRCCDALITNFHQPETTLMLLVAAFVGENWRAIYQTALDNNYRFLSYGDSSLLFLEK